MSETTNTIDSSRCMIVGAGNIGLQLLGMLSRDLSLVLVDASAEALKRASELRGNGLITHAGDATSRLVLEQAGIAGVDTVVITTSSEAVNIEVARVIDAHFDIPRVIAIGISQDGIRQLAGFGCEVEGIFKVSAIGLRNRLEQRTKTVHGIGLGKNEILEVEVHPHSRLANKPLASLKPRSWRAGIIYRDGNILVPRGDTILRPRDRVLVLGEPAVVRTVADLLAFRFTRFPLEFGDTLVAWLGEGENEALLAELDYLLEIFPLRKARLVCRRADETLAARLAAMAQRHRLLDHSLHTVARGTPSEALLDTLREQGGSAGLLVLPHPGQSVWSRPWHKQAIQQLIQTAGAPLLLARGSHPYSRVAVPCLEPVGAQAALETTLEMSQEVDYAIDALLVDVSPYIGAPEEFNAFTTMEKMVADLGLAYKRKVRPRTLEGNPVHAVTAALAESNLTVYSVSAWPVHGFWRALLHPDPAWETVRRTPVSTLLLPAIAAYA